MRIQALRAGRGLTQAELAKRAGIGRVTLVRIEAGQQDATVSTLAAIARALRVPIWGLFA